MAEGALEGEHTDYKMAGPHTTDFKYTRFDKSAARPRDTTKLGGKRVRRSKPARGTGASADVAPSAEDMAQAEAEAAAAPQSRRLGETALGWFTKLWHAVFG
jgi:hypothetical protein